MGVPIYAQAMKEELAQLFDQLRLCRKKRGWSATDIARRIDVNPTTVYSAEQGKEGTLRLAYKYAKAMNVQISLMVYDAGPKEDQEEIAQALEEVRSLLREGSV